MTQGQNQLPGRQVAQPADEEIKKHGDQLQKQVDDAAGKRPRDEPAADRRQNDGTQA